MKTLYEIISKNNCQLSKILIRQVVNLYETRDFWQYKSHKLEAIIQDCNTNSFII